VVVYRRRLTIAEKLAKWLPKADVFESLCKGLSVVSERGMQFGHYCALSLAIAGIESSLCRELSVNCSVVERRVVSKVGLIFDFRSIPLPRKLFAHRRACSSCHTGTCGKPFMAMGPTFVATR